jgi:hypothetical protein
MARILRGASVSRPLVAVVRVLLRCTPSGLNRRSLGRSRRSATWPGRSPRSVCLTGARGRQLVTYGCRCGPWCAGGFAKRASKSRRWDGRRAGSSALARNQNASGGIAALVVGRCIALVGMVILRGKAMSIPHRAHPGSGNDDEKNDDPDPGRHAVPPGMLHRDGGVCNLRLQGAPNNGHARPRARCLLVVWTGC